MELDGSIDDDELREMIDHSYGVVVSKLPEPNCEASTERPQLDRM